MSKDETHEDFRKERIAEINADPGSREALKAEHGDVWSTEEMRKEFTATGFGAPYISVVRNSDNQKGSLEFQHNPRFYFNFQTI